MMSSTVLRLPTHTAGAVRCEAQLSPIAGKSELATPLSIDRSSQDVLMNDLHTLSQRAAGQLPPAQPNPVLSRPDRGGPNATGSRQQETLLEGQAISCFVVGGERRLCFPQILSQVLEGVSLDEVNKAFADLRINVMVSSKEQLETLKVTGVMPMTSESCGLITKSNAERVVHCLLYERRLKRRRPMLNSDEPRKRAVPVVHDCFGGCVGSFLPDLYTGVMTECLECSECEEVFTPEHFVVHSHSDGERLRVCHWGFDSANWRSYVRLPEHLQEDEEMKTKLQQIKQRFDPFININNVGKSFKRGVQQQMGMDLECLRKRQRCSTFSGVKPTPQQMFVDTQQQAAALYQTLLMQQSLANWAKLSQQQQQQQQQQQHSVTGQKGLPEKTYDAAAGLIALSNAVQAHRPQPLLVKPTAHKAAAPFKKHLLHQFEQEKSLLKSQSVAAPIDQVKTEASADSQKTVSASENDEDSSLDCSLVKHVRDTRALKLIRAKITDSCRVLEMKIDHLSLQNHILQKEVDCLRKKEAREGPVQRPRITL